jgi:hypothetical protein
MTERDKTIFTEAFLCTHCGNKAPMQVVGTTSTVKTFWDDPPDVSYDEGHHYQLVRCPACSEVLLRRAYWHEAAMDPSEISYETIYPSRSAAPRGLPEKVRKAYDAANKVRNIDPNAYGVLLGRVLELVSEDREAKGNNLAAKLHDLSSRGEIPNKLAEVADGIRHLRNVGAHVQGQILKFRVRPDYRVRMHV